MFASDDLATLVQPFGLAEDLLQVGVFVTLRFRQMRRDVDDGLGEPTRGIFTPKQMANNRQMRKSRNLIPLFKDFLFDQTADHNRFIFKYKGLDQRLTGVEHAEPVNAIIA